LLLKDVGNDPIKKAELINQIAADISLIKDLMKRSMFMKECSVLLGVSEGNLVQTVNRLLTKSYIEERGKWSGEQASNEEKTAILEAVKDKTISQQKPTSKKLTIDDIERALLDLLVNFGEKTIRLRSV
jgi:DNA primase